MERMSVNAARDAGAIGREVRLQGWIRTRRDSKGGFSFLELNDGSSQANIQVVADAKLANYESEIRRLAAGCSVTIEGQVRQSPAKGQSTEVHAAADRCAWLVRSGNVSAAKEKSFVGISAHDRPSAAAHEHVRRDGPIAESGQPLDPRFFSGARVSLHPFADHHGQRLRRGRRDVQGHDARLAQAAAAGWQSRFQHRFFPPPGLSDRQRPVERRDFCLLARQSLHVRADVSRGEFEHVASSGRVLDGRAGDGVLRARGQHAAGRGVFETHLPRRPQSLHAGDGVLPRADRQDGDRNARSDLSAAISFGCRTPKRSPSWKNRAGSSNIQSPGATICRPSTNGISPSRNSMPR